MAQHARLDGVPAEPTGQLQLGQLVERGHRTQPTFLVAARPAIPGAAAEALLSGLATHPELGADGRPAAPGRPGGAHGLTEQVPDDVFGLDDAGNDGQRVGILLTRRQDGCAQTLGEIGRDASAAVPALQAAIDDSDAGVRKEAGEALKKIQK